MSEKPPTGVYPMDQAMQLINNDVRLVYDGTNATTLALVTDSNDLIFMKTDQMKTHFCSLFCIDIDLKTRPAFPVWLAREQKSPVKIIFANRAAGPDEFNLFSGFAISVAKGWSLAKPWLRHVFKAICGGNRHEFRYFMKWMAHAVQHPDVNPETWPILISRFHGTGKSMIYDLMELIFGSKHVGIVNKPVELYKDFNDHTKLWLFVMVDDAGRGKADDASTVRSGMTSSTRPIEGKFKPKVRIPNVIHAMPTSNSESAMMFGPGERRLVLFNVLDDYAGDFDYFGKIKADLTAGGAAQLFRIFMGIDLNGWHPRQIPNQASKLLDSQIEAANNVIQYLQDSCEAGGFLTNINGILTPLGGPIGFDADNPISLMHSCYVAWAKLVGKRPVSSNKMSRVLAEVLDKGEFYKAQIPQSVGAKFARGWYIPPVDEFELHLAAAFDIRAKRELPKNIAALRAAKAQQQAAAQQQAGAKPQSAKPAPNGHDTLPPGKEHLIRFAGKLAADLIAAWPKGKGKKRENLGIPIALDKLVADAGVNPKTNLAKAVKAIIDDARRLYPEAPEKLLPRAIAGFSGCVHDQRVLLALPDWSVALWDRSSLKTFKFNDPVSFHEMPVGILPLKDLSLFSTVANEMLGSPDPTPGRPYAAHGMDAGGPYAN
ncbi:primase-helicase family protein [Rhizobium sp. RAF56]|uniref:primase-helicase family protein n=1 Tax=Rhizobium sp. RAF56 TaxID=3233062 RepID=UPI003F97D069